MCGIVGYIGKNSLINVIDGLKSLEYRGYDSSGVGFFFEENIEIIKSVGDISKLEDKIDFDKYSNVNVAIGHTRWATHGNVNIKNSHPFTSNNLILIHNGIIENYKELKDFLLLKGYEFESDVDSEVALHLIDYYYENHNYLEAINKACSRIKGMYSFLILFKDNPNTIYGTKKDAPLYISNKDNECIIASDLIGIVTHTDNYYSLLDNEIFVATSENISFYDIELKVITKKKAITNLKKESTSKQGYAHYMLKEIYEQEKILNDIQNTSLDYLASITKNIEEIVIVGCGSAMHAGLIGKYLFEELLSIPTKVEIASEFRYSPFLYKKNTLFIFISQSGETADTIAALKLAKEHNATTLGLVNTLNSTIANECDYLIPLNVGKEISVASTKAYYAQVLYLYKLSFLLSKTKNIDLDKLEKEFNSFKLNISNENGKLKLISKLISKKKNIFYIGRNIDYYLSLEGSLKLKEITYINSNAIPSGELKHGTISLIDKRSLIIAVMSKTSLKSKSVSNIEEILSRNGKVILISNESLNKNNVLNIKIDTFDSDYLLPLSIIPILQLLAYYCALYKKTNIDKPKNLAKSVTVE